MRISALHMSSCPGCLDGFIDATYPHQRRPFVLIVAIGNPNVIQANWIQPGCIVIDVGINRSDDGRIIGDVPTEATAARQAYVSVVPGGVGPLTVAHLVNNLYRLYCIQHP